LALGSTTYPVKASVGILGALFVLLGSHVNNSFVAHTTVQNLPARKKLNCSNGTIYGCKLVLSLVAFISEKRQVVN